VIKFVYNRTGSVGKGNANESNKLAPAGLFLVTKVAGKEKQVDRNRDRLLLKISGFLRQPGGKSVEPAAASVVNIFLGNVNIGTFAASNLVRDKQGRLVFVNKDSSQAPLVQLHY